MTEEKFNALWHTVSDFVRAGDILYEHYEEARNDHKKLRERALMIATRRSKERGDNLSKEEIIFAIALAKDSKKISKQNLAKALLQ